MKKELPSKRSRITSAERPPLAKNPCIAPWKEWFRWTPSFVLIVSLGLATLAETSSNSNHQVQLDLPPKSDLSLLQCGNVIYDGNKSSVCFADRFLTEIAEKTNLRVNKKFGSVRLDAEAIFDYPFCVMSGNESFSFTEKERAQLRKYLEYGGFLLASPGCSDETWDKSFRKEIKLCFPELSLKAIPMSHPIFSLENRITRLKDKHGKEVMLEGLEINGRLVLVYSKEGLNDVEHAEGCCCCGGNEITNPALVNVNIFTYSVLH